jgi:putative SOS response-associated peptidase YedK
VEEVWVEDLIVAEAPAVAKEPEEAMVVVANNNIAKAASVLVAVEVAPHINLLDREVVEAMNLRNTITKWPVLHEFIKHQRFIVLSKNWRVFIDLDKKIETKRFNFLLKMVSIERL